MRREDIDTALVAANPVRAAAVEGSLLEQIDRRLQDAIARDRAASSGARVRVRLSSRGQRLGAIAFATLALGGSALAATGIWSPLGSGQRTEKPAGPGGTAKAPAGSRGQAQVPPGQGGGAPRTAAHHEARARKAPDLPPAEPAAAPRSGESGEPSAPTDGGPSEPSGGASPATPGPGAPGGGGKAVSPKHGGSAPSGPPAGGPPEPRPTRLSVICRSPNGLDVGCQVTVTGESGAPTGQVALGGPSTAGFSATTCTLNDDGDGISSSCRFEYVAPAPGAPPLEVTATYSGDASNAPSSTVFST